MSSACLLAPTGERRELTSEEYDTVVRVLDIVGPCASAGCAEESLSTGQVAELLGVSRRTVVRAIDAGKLPCARSAGGHRSVSLADALAYKAERDRRSDLLSELHDIEHDIGLYDVGVLGGFERMGGRG